MLNDRAAAEDVVQETLLRLWSRADRFRPERARERLRDTLPLVRPLRGELRAAQQAVREAVSAETFDAAALQDALGRLRDAGNRYEQFMHDNLVELAATLPPAERVALVRAALERRPAGPRTPRRPAPP